MISIRIMTYNINGCCGRDGHCDPERIAAIVEDHAPDIVALQEVDAAPGRGQLDFLADKLGMNPYGQKRKGANGFLSYYPLTAVRDFDLGYGGLCQTADLEKDGRRIHIFNVRLSPKAAARRQQIKTLLGPDLLSSQTYSCPILILGDFGDCFYGAGNLTLKFMLQGARRPSLWGGTYPAKYPFFNRDRAYLQGDLRILNSQIIRSKRCRNAALHLPLILTIQMIDPRIYLRSKKPLKTRGRMEVVHG